MSICAIAVLPPAHASLEYNNDDPSRYTLCTQKLKGLQPQLHYVFSAEVWAEHLNTSLGPGDATVCVQWSDNEGRPCMLVSLIIHVK